MASDDQSANAIDTPTHVGDDTEHELGISVYLSPHHAGFSGVLKGRYSDFVVHEVGLDGSVARLESIEYSEESLKESKQKEIDVKCENDNRKRKAETELEREKRAKKQAGSDSFWEDIESELKAIIGEEGAKNVVDFFKQDYKQQSTRTSENDKEEEPEKEDAPLFVSLSPLSNKETRRQIHQWIKTSALSQLATTDTGDDEKGNKIIRFWPIRHETKMPNHGKFDKHGNRGHGQNNQKRGGPRIKRPDGYLQFVLYKENCDTHAAIKQVTHRLGGNAGRRGGRGNHHHYQSKVRVGYAGMKDKRGITSQFVTVYQRSPHEIEWVNHCHSNNKNHGGGNSSKGGTSVIRVGNFSFVNKEISLGNLRGNRFDVVLRNIQTDQTHDRETTKQIVTQSNEDLRKHGFINYFGVQRFGKFHDTHLAGIALLKGDFEQVIEIIMRPKQGEQPKILEARKKWAGRFNKLSENASLDVRAKAEADCAKYVVRSFGRFMSSEISVLESLSRTPLDYKKAFSCIGRTMRMMFLHAVQSLLWNRAASFRVAKMGRQIVVGDLISEQNASDFEPGATVRVVTEDDIAANRLSLEDVMLPLLGRKSIRPENESGKLYDKLMEDIGISVDMFGNVQDRELTCPGDYRKLICRPSDVECRLVEYRDPLQPLLQTDLMKLNGVDVIDNNYEEDDKPALLGMVVGFTLPPSAYATVAIRELMKKPTSSDYQKGLEMK